MRIRKVSLLFTVFCCFGINLFAQDTALARKFFDLGKALYSKNKYDEAIDNYNSAIKYNPKYGEAYVYKSMVYLKKKNKVQEFQNLDKAIEVEPLVKNYGSRANAYAYHKEYRKQLADLNIILKKKPADAYYLSQRGTCYEHLNENDLALTDFKAAAALSNAEYDYVKLANLYYKMEKYTAANQSIDKAIKKWTPGFFSAEKEINYVSKGKILIALDSNMQAITYLSQYIDKVFLFRDNDVYKYRSVAYCNIGDTKKATTDAEAYKKGGGKTALSCNKTTGGNAAANSTTGKLIKYDLAGTGLTIQSPFVFEKQDIVLSAYNTVQMALVMWSASEGGYYTTVTYEKYSNNKQPREALEFTKTLFLERNPQGTASISGTKFLGHPALLLVGTYTDKTSKKNMRREVISYGEFGTIYTINMIYPDADKVAASVADKLFASVKEDSYTPLGAVIDIPTANWKTYRFGGLRFQSPSTKKDTACNRLFNQDVTRPDTWFCYKWETDFSFKTAYYANAVAALAADPTALANKEKKAGEELNKMLNDKFTSFEVQTITVKGASAAKLVTTTSSMGVGVVEEKVFIKKGTTLWVATVSYNLLKDYTQKSAQRVLSSLEIVE